MMKVNKYSPEKDIIVNKISSLEDLVRLHENDEIISCKVIKSTKSKELVVQVGKFTGIIPSGEVEAGFPDGCKKGRLTKLVGHNIKAVITDIRKDYNGLQIELSRAECQQRCFEEYVSKLEVGDVVKARVDGIESYGIFCDIGCGVKALLPISAVCMMPILDIHEQLKYLDEMYVSIASINKDTGKITLSHKELLGTWNDEVSDLRCGDTVIGTVINKTDYGVFISLGQNLKGVADITEKSDSIDRGDKVSVYVKSINKDKMKIKLKLINLVEQRSTDTINFKYFITDGNVKDWKYFPEKDDKDLN